MHWVMFHLDLRGLLTRRFGVKRWVCSDREVSELVGQVREQFRRLLGQRDETL
jgi:hypothetical protein